MDSKIRLFQVGALCGVIMLVYGQTLDFGAMRYFDDPLYFSRRFAALFGLPATAYRSRHAVRS